MLMAIIAARSHGVTMPLNWRRLSSCQRPHHQPPIRSENCGRCFQMALTSRGRMGTTLGTFTPSSWNGSINSRELGCLMANARMCSLDPCELPTPPHRRSHD